MVGAQVLAAGRNLKVWGGDPKAAPTYDCMIAQDKEIVKVVLLLAGSIEGTKHGIKEYVSTFEQYSFLWQRDLQTEYAAFMATHPSLEVRRMLPPVHYPLCLFAISPALLLRPLHAFPPPFCLFLATQLAKSLFSSGLAVLKSSFRAAQ